MQFSIVRSASPSLSISGTTNAVVVQQPQSSVVEVASPGPQGPGFVGTVFMDIDTIETLASGDTGKLLVWNGSQYTATNILSDNLTIVGGAF